MQRDSERGRRARESVFKGPWTEGRREMASLERVGERKRVHDERACASERRLAERDEQRQVRERGEGRECRRRGCTGWSTATIEGGGTREPNEGGSRNENHRIRYPRGTVSIDNLTMSTADDDEEWGTVVEARSR